ncbi:MAG TPA: ketopantoate reductase C-terminal domain-containing protein, partial [Solirubrobacteraceae bacterium]
ALEAAGFPTRTAGRIREDIWTKLMGNATFNPISTLTGAGLATMATDPATRAVIAAAMEEVVAVAGALGVPISMSIEERLDITARLGDHKPSTLQDLEAGKPLELGAICHAVLELADDAGIPSPNLRAIVALATLHARQLGLRVG